MSVCLFWYVYGFERHWPISNSRMSCQQMYMYGNEQACYIMYAHAHRSRRGSWPSPSTKKQQRVCPVLLGCRKRIEGPQKYTPHRGPGGVRLGKGAGGRGQLRHAGGGTVWCILSSPLQEPQHGLQRADGDKEDGQDGEEEEDEEEERDEDRLWQ